MNTEFPVTFPEIRSRPSGILLDTRKVKDLKKKQRISDDFIARQSGRTTKIVQLTVNNKSQGIETQRAIATVLGVPLEDICMQPSIGADQDNANAA